MIKWFTSKFHNIVETFLLWLRQKFWSCLAHRWFWWNRSGSLPSEPPDPASVGKPVWVVFWADGAARLPAAPMIGSSTPPTSTRSSSWWIRRGLLLTMASSESRLLWVWVHRLRRCDRVFVFGPQLSGGPGPSLRGRRGEVCGGEDPWRGGEGVALPQRSVSGSAGADAAAPRARLSGGEHAG